MPATYEKIATTTLGSAAANIDFTSIGSTFTDLRIVFTGDFAAADRLCIRFNSDTATNYSTTRLRGDGAAASSSAGTSNDAIIPGAGTLTGIRLQTMDIFSYAGSTNKTTLVNLSNDQNGSGQTLCAVGLWRSTSAITSIRLFGYSGNNITSGSTATLYGILKA